MKKICIISAGLLPVPAVLGGAIETIIDNIISENEKYKLLDLTVVSMDNKNSKELSKKFKNTKFIYINKKSLIYIFNFLTLKLKKILFKKSTSTYVYNVLKKIKHMKFDKIIVEGGSYDSYELFLKYFDRDQMMLHLHHHYFSNDTIDKSFGYVITVSDFISKEWLKSSNKHTVITLKNCIDINKFNKELKDNEKKELKKIYNIKEDDFVVIYCGRLIKGKGVLELVQAVKKIKNKKIKLLVVGSINFANGGNDSYTEKLNQEAKNTDKIIFTGYIANNELYKYYKLADIMVIPSLCEEAAGLVCIEGMICRKPIITTDAGGIKEYVNKNAIIVKRNEKFVANLQNSILELYQKRDEFIKLGKENYDCALKYNNENYYNNLVKIINDNSSIENKGVVDNEI